MTACSSKEIYGIIPNDLREQYDVREVIARIETDSNSVNLEKISKLPTNEEFIEKPIANSLQAIDGLKNINSNVKFLIILMDYVVVLKILSMLY